MKKTFAVVVTYNPDAGIAGRLKSIARECIAVHVIDNGSSFDSLKMLRQAAKTPRVKLLELGENTGIAHAQNVGLTLSFEKGADGVILFDHDSQPRPGFSEALWQAYKAEKNPVIAGAQIFDIHTGHFSRYPAYAGPFFRRAACDPHGVLPGVMLAIASGALISRAVYQKTGGMEENLFIDYVDWEYCLRARKRHGINTIICGGAVLEHARGERRARRFLGLTVRPPGYSLFRYRQIYRNRALLFRRYFFKAPSFIAFETVSICRDTLLLFAEEQALKKFFAAIGAWLRGFFCTA